MVKKVRLVSFVVLLAISLFLLGWAVFPTRRVFRDSTLDSAASSPLLDAAPSLSASEMRHLTTAYPPVIRVGDSDRITLRLEKDESGAVTPTLDVDGQAVIGETVELPASDDAYTVLLVARLDMVGMEVVPEGEISEAAIPNSPSVFYWSVRPMEAGAYRGTLWLFVEFVPKEGGAPFRRALAAQELKIRATTLLGLSGASARFFGSAGSLLSSVLGFPFLEDAVRWVLERVRSPRGV